MHGTKNKPFLIAEPYHSKHAFGISATRIYGDGDFYVKCIYLDKHGNFPWPWLYSMPRQKIKTYPLERHGGRLLYIVPITDFTVLYKVETPYERKGRKEKYKKGIVQPSAVSVCPCNLQGQPETESNKEDPKRECDLFDSADIETRRHHYD